MGLLDFFKSPRPRTRVAVIGLDCAEPSLVFDRWADRLPNLARLRRRGVYGDLESVIPAITVPAWSCMTTGRDPGALGIYGFRNRDGYSYSGLRVPTAADVRPPRVWDLLAGHGKHVTLLGVPQTFPPPAVNGEVVASFLAPNTDAEYTHPASLAAEIRDWVGDYMLDVKGFRTDDKAWLLEQIHEMTRKRFEVARRLLDTRPWDFFMMVEMGVDRIHHGFWKDLDPAHPRHDPESPFKDAILEYYEYVDGEIGTLLERFDEDTHVLVVSDHGAQTMQGGICINEWLIREGYLVLEEEPDLSDGPVRLEKASVDWSRTRAWGEGGYYGRVFLNVRGREEHGAVDPGEYEAVRDELAGKLAALGDARGEPIGTRCFRPEELYPEVEGLPPDLLVYFGDLRWRSVGSIGWDAIHVVENDTGPDDANHAQQGMFLYADPKRDLGGRRLDGLHLLQIAPTVLELFGLDAPFEMQRESIAEVVGRQPAETA
jgi:predicted AlkP superfamily phosphohydrolase/phosphomutase